MPGVLFFKDSRRVDNNALCRPWRTEKLQKYADLKAELVWIWQLKTTCIIPLAISTTGIGTNSLHECLKLPNLCSALYSNAESSNTQYVLYSQKVFGSVMNDNHLNCCEVRRVDGDDDDEHYHHHHEVSLVWRSCVVILFTQYVTGSLLLISFSTVFTTPPPSSILH